MTFAADILTDLDTLLDTDEFAESITYYPTGGEARSITVTVSRQDQRQDDQAHHRLQRESLFVLARDHATTGIDTPQLGDAVRLAGDESDVRWDFVKVLHRGSSALYLQFDRAKNIRPGQHRPAAL